MVLSFKKQFEKPIKNGCKIHTIRLDPKRRWKPGMKIHFATGVRTKNYNQFHSGIVTSVQEIGIYHSKGLVQFFIGEHSFGEVWHHGLDDIYEYTDDVLQLAINDGFKDLEEFFKWFDKSFCGVLIHWTELKY